MPRQAVVRGSLFLKSFKRYGSLYQTSEKLYHGGAQNVLADQSIATTNGIVTSPFPSVDVPKVNVVDYIWRNTTSWDDKDLITCAISGRTYTYGSAKQLINQGAQALLTECGLQPGDVVAMYLPNLPEYIVLTHAVLVAGLTLTSVNPLSTYDELLRQFQIAGVKVIITISLFLDNAVKVGSLLPGYQTTVCLDGKDDQVNNVKSLFTLVRSNKKTTLPQTDSNDVAFLPFSSGTTGLPKGVKLSHFNLTANLVQTNHPDLAQLAEHERFLKGLTVLPFFHIYGYNSIMNSSIMEGLHMVTLPKFTPEDYIKALVQHQPSYLLVVPSLLLFLASHPLVTKDHLASVTTICSGAALATEEVIQKFKEKVGKDVQVRQGYGLTETSPVITMTPKYMPSSKKNSTGVLVSNTEVKVVDITTLDVLGSNHMGEVWVKGPQVMSGYLNNEEATREILGEDGWLHTGDIGYYDEDGYFYIVDRCKDLIKVKGNQVSPTELERLIVEVPGVADAAVIGIPDTQAGELPRAFVVKRQNANVTEEEIHSYLAPKVSPYKRLLGGIKFISAIPRNPGGKILRMQLKSLK